MKHALLIFTFIMVTVSSAYADSIDGDWCNLDGSRLRITGSQIELGDGVFVRGQYSRHAFSYIAPQGDFEAGKIIDFIMRSEDEMRRVRVPNAMPEHADIWQRCQNIS